MKKLIVMVCALGIASISWAEPMGGGPMGGGSGITTVCTNGQVVTYNTTTGKWDTCASLAGSTPSFDSVRIGTMSSTPVAIADADATPDISAGTVFYTANTGATTITGFDFGAGTAVNGKMFRIVVLDANTTFDFTSSNLLGLPSDYTAALGDVLDCTYLTAASKSYCTAFPRTANFSTLVLPNGTGTPPTAEGSTYWQSTTDTLTIGDGSAAVSIPRKVSAGTSDLGEAEIASGDHATLVSTAATGVATTDVINWGFNTDIHGITGYAPSANGMLTIIAYPTSGYVNFLVVNNTGAAITPGAVTLNWAVYR